MLSLFLALSTSKVVLNLNDERQFVSWMRNNNAFYTGDEYHLRLGIFLTNLRYVQNFNRKKGLTFRLSVNKFACYTPSEYNSLLGLRFSNHYELQSKIETKESVNSPIPDSFDWREKKFVNPIKDQASCGAGWAFSSIASSETAYAISFGTLPSLSEQNLIDCVIFCFGCTSGSPQDALGYVRQIQKGSFNSESDYPYTGSQGTCKFDKDKSVGKFTEYALVIAKDENDLKERVAWHGVASACISASSSQFQLYSGGILDDSSCTDKDKLDHAVAVVGYGTENGTDYWIVRNSWGTAWGEQGYVRMIRNKENQCGIASRALVALAYDI